MCVSLAFQGLRFVAIVWGTRFAQKKPGSVWLWGRVHLMAWTICELRGACRDGCWISGRNFPEDRKSLPRGTEAAASALDDLCPAQIGFKWSLGLKEAARGALRPSLPLFKTATLVGSRNTEGTELGFYLPPNAGVPVKQHAN